ncbi:hypothetical protein H1Q59_02555 [Holosporaceae bacterium 'Namur']|nr:hypothetical protein [Holosporaceae bacterium 'Namur']
MQNLFSGSKPGSGATALDIVSLIGVPLPIIALGVNFRYNNVVPLLLTMALMLSCAVSDTNLMRQPVQEFLENISSNWINSIRSSGETT